VVQADPIRPTLKLSGTKRLKLKFDGPPSNFAFKFNLRRYIKASYRRLSLRLHPDKPGGQGLTLVHFLS